MANKYNLYRWAKEHEYVKKTFENIMLNKCSKLEQIRFIERETDKDPFKIQALHSDLLDFIDQVESWNGSYEFFNQMVNRISPDFDSKVAIQDFLDIVNGFLKNEKIISESINHKQINPILPEPFKIAEQYHIEKGSKHKEYTAEQIAPVMEVTKNYIEENPGLRTIHGHIKPITDKCKGLPGGRDAKSNWIKFYAEKAGLETK